MGESFSVGGISSPEYLSALINRLSEGLPGMIETPFSPPFNIPLRVSSASAPLSFPLVADSVEWHL